MIAISLLCALVIYLFGGYLDPNHQAKKGELFAIAAPQPSQSVLSWQCE
jgi:hypothetical protein